jgi:DNA cross-link repair 1A protein
LIAHPSIQPPSLSLTFLFQSHTLSNNYFLTHFHSDHYGGITRQWNEGTIYCSAPTANLVNQQLGVEKRWLHPLPMNTPTVVESRGKPITVTLLDANHCPGAVMFLFEVGNKRLLHVGDFRWNNFIMMEMPQLRAFSTMKPRLDEIFLDTTYCDPKYTLPTQNEVIAAAIKVVKDEISTAMEVIPLGKKRCTSLWLNISRLKSMSTRGDTKYFRLWNGQKSGWPCSPLSNQSPICGWCH